MEAIDTARTGQVAASAAGTYETFFVPALFGQFAAPLAEAAALVAGHRVLDVACGTGVFAREAQRRVGTEGRVTGIDRNDDMLAVARGTAPGIVWKEGRAEALPFPDAVFDAAVCAFGLMFFEDRSAALGEMWRVLRPGGRFVVAVWDRAENSPGYAAMIALLDRLFGSETADALRAPFVLGETTALAAELAAARIPEPVIHTLPGTARFGSLEDWVHTDVKGWTLADRIDEEGYRRLRSAALSDLRAFAGSDGAVTFAAPAHLALAVKP